MMPRTRLPRLLCAAALMLVSIARADDAFFLKEGDRVVFYGDSITDQRQYTTFTETFVVTRFPKMNVEFIHSGWSGDRVGGGGGGNIATRLERDVFAYKPTVMTVMLGMNDGSYRPFDETIFTTYKTGLASIVRETEAKLPGIRMTLIQPSPFDDVTREPKFPGGYNSVLVRYGEAVQEIARSTNQHVADLNAPVVAMLEKAKATNAELAAKIINDRVHPGPAGHLIMAGALLRAWNAPALVSGVEIDAKTQRVSRAINTEVTNLKIASGSLEWTQLDHALPMPIDMSNAEIALAVKSSDWIESLNRQPLRVTGLPAAAYELSIDGRTLGVFPVSELVTGLNLAVLATPMAAQAAEVHKLTINRANLHNTRWRSFQVPYANTSANLKPHLEGVMTALETATREAAAMQRAAARPTPHQFKLVAVTADDLALAGEAITVIPDSFGANLALNKSWTSSAPNTYGWDSGLTDGSWTGGRTTTYATDDQTTFPKTVTIDLGEPRKIGRIVIGVPGFGSTKTVQVAISSDGSDFKTIGRHGFLIRKEEKRLFTFAPTTARQVRLTYLDHHAESAGYAPFFAFTSDVQVFAPAAR